MGTECLAATSLIFRAIFGTKAMVISWTCVRACGRTSITGLTTTISVKIASRNTSKTTGPIMQTHLDRHLHDVFIGRYDAVAHGDDSIDRDLGCRDGGDDVDDFCFCHWQRRGSARRSCAPGSAPGRCGVESAFAMFSEMIRIRPACARKPEAATACVFTKIHRCLPAALKL